MGKLIWILLIALCLIAVNAKKAKDSTKEEAATPAASSGNASDEDNANAEDENKDDDDDSDDSAKAAAEPTEAKAETTEDSDAVAKSDTESKDDDAATEDDSSDTADASEEEETADAAPIAKAYECNLKFKRVGCYADNSKKEKPLRSFIMTDADLGPSSKKGKLPKGDKFNSHLPKFACKCANEAINSGNAIFGIQNIAECWTGPDDSKYDKDGESNECVTLNYAQCQTNSELCAGKKHANFVYYVDSEEHTKSKEDIQREYAEYQKRVADHERKKALKKKSAKKLKKKSKKAKKE